MPGPRMLQHLYKEGSGSLMKRASMTGQLCVYNDERKWLRSRACCGADPVGGRRPLSAGQKQLVALARALLRHSKVRPPPAGQKQLGRPGARAPAPLQGAPLASASNHVHPTPVHGRRLAPSQQQAGIMLRHSKVRLPPARPTVFTPHPMHGRRLARSPQQDCIMLCLHSCAQPRSAL